MNVECGAVIAWSFFQRPHKWHPIALRLCLTKDVHMCKWGMFETGCFHYDVINWKHFPRYWPFVRGFHRSPVNFPHKGQCRGALMFSLICTRINGWVNNGEAGDFRRDRAHYDVTVMCKIYVDSFHWIIDNSNHDSAPFCKKLLSE